VHAPGNAIRTKKGDEKMSTIHPQSEAFWSAKEQEKQREQKARDAAILRALNSESTELKEVKLKLMVSRITMGVAIIANFYAAAKNYGVL
jgi:hypothetical protein